MSNTQLFLELLFNLDKSPRRYLYHCSSTKFSTSQKLILKGYYAYTKNRKDEAFSYLRRNNFSTRLEEGLRLYFLSLTYNKFGYLNFAFEKSKLSLNYLKKTDTDLYLLAICECITICLNQVKTKEVRSLYKALEEIEPVREHCKAVKRLHITRSLFAFKEYDRVMNNCHNALQGSEKFKASYILLQFKVHLAKKEFDKAYELANIYVDLGDSLKINREYMFSILDYITKDKIFSVDLEIFRSTPELFNQMSVLNCLRDSNIGSAQIHWQELIKHNPALYLNDFKYSIDNDLFSLALKKIYNKQLVLRVPIDSIELVNTKKMIDKLAYIIDKYDGTVPKSHLVKLLWNEEVTDRNLKKLSRLIAKYKVQNNIIIKSKKSHYKIVA